MQHFAEHLSRINSVSLTVEAEAKIDEIRLEGSEARVVSQGNSLAIKLPAEVESSVVKVNDTQCALRVPCLAEIRHIRSEQWINTAPWSATELSKQPVCIYSKKTGAKLTDTIKVWKQLPSEHWAELMDFWHCHKPHTADESFNPIYSVSEFVPEPGMAFVGDAYFSVDEADFGDCPEVVDGKIWKWDVDIRAQGLKQYPLSAFVACILCELIDSHAIYSFHIADPERKHQMLIWVFSRDITYTYTEELEVLRGLKVFYSTEKAQFAELKQTRGDIEEVELPGNVIKELQDALGRSHDLLPVKARHFGPWKIGLLDRE